MGYGFPKEKSAYQDKKEVRGSICYNVCARLYEICHARPSSPELQVKTVLT